MSHMTVCPACKGRVFGYRAMLGMTLDGLAQCPKCGALSRLDPVSRCLVTGMLALLLWLLLLYGEIFFSGFLFLFSMTVIIFGWRLLCAAWLPLLTLEAVPRHTRFDRRQNIATLAALFVTAIVIDGLLSYRSDADKRHAASVSASESPRSQ